jgi:hypothetical protein
MTACTPKSSGPTRGLFGHTSRLVATVLLTATVSACGSTEAELDKVGIEITEDSLIGSFILFTLGNVIQTDPRSNPVDAFEIGFERGRTIGCNVTGKIFTAVGLDILKENDQTIIRIFWDTGAFENLRVIEAGGAIESGTMAGQFNYTNSWSTLEYEGQFGQTLSGRFCP